MIVVPADTFVPIFVGLLLGYLVGLWKFVDNQNVRTLITFVMSVALPCSLFGTIGQLSRAAVEQQGEVVAVLGITYVAVFLFVYFWGGTLGEIFAGTKRGAGSDVKLSKCGCRWVSSFARTRQRRCRRGRTHHWIDNRCSSNAGGS